MKTNISHLFLAPALITALNLLPAGRVTAQTFTTLHSFTATSTNASGDYTNSDGAGPVAGLITNSTGNTLYGTTSGGGTSGNGTVFAVNTDGTGFTNLHNFTGDSDGAYPQAGLILSGNTLYGTASEGGSGGLGTVFAVSTAGTGFTTLHSFAGSDGDYPVGGLILAGNILYGTAEDGGSGYPNAAGTVFAVNTDGTGFTTLHRFNDFGREGDGAYPSAGLIINSSGNTLYGTTVNGGSSDSGTVFAVNTNGTGFTNLHSFAGGSDGAGPQAGLVLVAGFVLYGTTVGGGSSSAGTVFAVPTNGCTGCGFGTVHNFTASSTNASGVYTNSDGANPEAGLILSSNNTLYGTAAGGGSSGYGTVFAVYGTGFTTLHSFTGFSDGANPSAGLVLSGNTLYGTANRGGSTGNGTVFSLSFRPQLTITPSGIPPSGIILSWPTNVAGFDYTGYTLQSTTNLVSPVVWSTNSPAPVVIAGQNTVTNPITGAQQFYWLVQ